MINDRKVYTLLIAIALGVVVGVAVMNQLSFSLSLSPQEQRLLAFHREGQAAIVERKDVAMAGTRCPISFVPLPDHVASLAALSESMPRNEETAAIHPKVSMILVNPSNRMAVVDGRLVSEGDQLGLARVVKIERNRVLLHNKKGEIWLTFE